MRRAESGFTLIEVLVAILALGLAVGGILMVVSGAERGMGKTREALRARLLATEIYEEIAALDRGAPEAADTARTRAEFTSPLDYDGLVEIPPETPTGEPLEGAGSYERRITIRRVDPEKIDREVSAEKSELLEITVDVKHGGRPVETLRFLKSLR